MTTAVEGGGAVTDGKAARAARAARARKEGNERRAAETKPAPRRRTRTASVTSLPVAKVIVPDSAERQAAAALKRLQEAEAQRPKANGRPATATELQEDLRASRVPVHRRRTAGQVADEAEHEFDLDEALKKMEVEYIQCRDFGHSWRPHTARWIAGGSLDQGHYESQLKCVRCSTVRTRLLSRSGAQIQGHYEYADGYLVKGIGRLSGEDRDKVRLRSILSVLKS